MPFYADPNRFPTPVWQADPTQGWAQGQFIQQIPHAPQTPLEGYPQQYPNAIYQTTYQQPGFESNTFYASPVQVLTNQRPPSQPPHAPLTPRANGTYSHTPSPSPISQNQQNGHRSNISGQYTQEYPQAGQSFNAPATTPTGNMETTSNGGISRPSSVGSNVNASGNQNQNFTPTSNSFTTISSSNFSPGSNAPPSYAGSNMQNQTNSGNAKPGYPQVSSSPQLASHNSSGYPGGQFSGQNIQPNNQNQITTNDQHSQHQSWTPERDRNSWEQNVTNEIQHQGFVQHNNQHNMQNMGHNQNQMMMKTMNMQIVNTVQAQNNSHLQQPIQSPQSHQQNNQMQMHMQQQNNMNQSPNHHSHQMHNQAPNGGDAQFSQADRVNLNSRIKTMILNKQQNMEGKIEEGQKGDENNTTGHFLSYSHHRRLNYFSDGGGLYDFNPTSNGSALENIMKFASNENYTQPKWNHENSNVNHPPYKPFSYPENSSLDKNILMNMKTDNYYSYNENPLTHKQNNSLNNSQFIEKPHTAIQIPKIAINKKPIPIPINQNNQYEFTKPSKDPYLPKIKEYQPPNIQNVFIKPEPYQKYQPQETQCKVEPIETVKCNTTIETSQYTNQDFKGTEKISNPIQDIKVEVKEIKLEKEAYVFEGHGGPAALNSQVGSWCCRRGGTEAPTPEHLKDGVCMGLQTQDEILEEKNPDKKNPNQAEVKNPNEKPNANKEYNDNIEKLKNNIKTEIPDCSCFPADKSPPEPGSYYTHLGCASSLPELRKELENRIGITGKALRIEKVCYTGKEGKTTQGCPLAKWIIRRSSYEEKILAIVKHRQGHSCTSAFIVVCIVAWEGIPSAEADQTYNLLTHKLNRYGLPTTRRCATNEPRTCACQGLDPDTCGASFSFGCSWSMYYNGCKYARSKTVRKFRLSVKTEENEIEEKMHVLSTLLSPLYNNIAPNAFQNQCQFEREASECRLGFKTGRPFSGVTACLDFCSHSHRDLHNMNNGCTVVVSLTKHRSLSKPTDEQLHVLPLYVVDESDEFGSKETQDEKFKNGSIERLTKYPCEVRVRSVPLQPCRRHGKKRKEDEPDAVINKKESPASPRGSAHSPRSGHGSPRSQTPVSHQTPLVDMVSMLDNFTDAQLQSSQVSSTVLDSPTMYPAWNYESGLLNNQNQFVNQYPNQNQLYPPNQAWLEAQKRQNPYLHPNTWGENAGAIYKDGIKEDPDSTTAIPNMNLEEKINQVGSPLPNSRVDEKSRENRTYLNSINKFTPNSQSSLPINNCHQTIKSPQNMYEHQNVNHGNTWTNDINRNPYNGDNLNTANNPNPQSIQYTQQPSPNVPISHIPKAKSPIIRHQVDQKVAWSTPERTNWEQINPPSHNDISPFRIPKSRPPSRTPNNPAISPDTNTHANTFLKPYPPENRNSQTPETVTPPSRIINNQNNGSHLTNNHLKQMENLHSSFNNWNEDIKGNINDYHSAVNPNYINQNYPNPAYGNLPSHFNSYNPYHPYETPPLNYEYNPLYNAEKLKREEYIRNSACYNSYGYQNYPNWCQNTQNWVQNTPNWCIYPPFGIPYVPEQPKSEPIGVITDYIDNIECFKDSQMGGVAIALGHGSVLFECAKHEMHSTTALRKPNRLSPTRISLVFYQHRNLNKPKHGLEEWEEKMRLRKLGITTTTASTTTTITNIQAQGGINSEDKEKDKEKEVDLAALIKASTGKNGRQIMMRAPTLTTVSWTTLFPMHPCMVTGPYQDGGAVG